MSLFGLFSKKKQPEPARTPAPAATPPKKEEGHRVAGIAYRLDDIMKLAIKNDDYSLKKKELIDRGLIGGYVYEYEFPISKVELIPEPTNEYDPKAIKVVADGVHIGYIKKGSCSHVHNLLNGDMIKDIRIKMKGGKYKMIIDNSGYDEDPDYELEKDEDKYSANLTLVLK